MDVKDIMTRSPISIEPNAPLGTAIAVMTEQKIHHLPVLDDDGALVGIITDRDLRSAVLAPALEQYLPVIENGKLVGIVTDRDAVKALAITVPALKYVAETLW